MSTQVSDFQGKTYAPAQSKLLLLLLRKNPLQLSISQLSVKQESSLWQENSTQRNALPPLPPFCSIFAATFQNIKPYPIF
jgi:hypothetical protein